MRGEIARAMAAQHLRQTGGMTHGCSVRRIKQFERRGGAGQAVLRQAALELDGKTIGVNDLHIAAHARSKGLTLVSNNLREFERVPGLLLENWV